MAYEPDYDTDMSFDDAASALTEAMSSEAGEAPAPSTPPAEQAPVAPTQTAPAESEGQGEQPVEDSPTFFNPDDLPEELLPGWKQMQAAYTRKTQELAEQRRYIEQFGAPDEVADAVELYQRLQDPDNWVQLHGEITQALTEAGYSLGEAQAMASQEMQAQSQDLGIDVDDPDLQPLVGQLTSLQNQLQAQQAYLAEMEAQREYQAQVQEAERAHQEYVAHMQSQVSALREAYPHYTDKDLRAVVELGSFYNDDLSQAAARYEEFVTDRLERYLSQKSSATSPSHAPGKSVVSTPVEDEVDNIRDIEEEMVDLFRGLQADGQIEW